MTLIDQIEAAISLANEAVNETSRAPNISRNSAITYVRHLKAFRDSDIAAMAGNGDRLSRDDLEAWINKYAPGAAKAKQTIAALKFINRTPGCYFHLAETLVPPKQTPKTIKDNDYITPSTLAEIRRRWPLERFGTQHPERNRAIVLLTMDTLASVEDIRQLRNNDVTTSGICFRTRPLARQTPAFARETINIALEYRTWRSERYGPAPAEQPLFRSTRESGNGSVFLTQSGIYRIFHHIIAQITDREFPAGEGLNLFRMSCARKMYCEGVAADRLIMLLGIRDSLQALEESLRVSDNMRNARERAMEKIRTSFDTSNLHVTGKAKL